MVVVHGYVEKVEGTEPVIASVDEAPVGVVGDAEDGTSVKQTLPPP